MAQPATTRLTSFSGRVESRMSMTDGPDVDDFDRRPDSLDRERGATGPSSQTRGRARPVGTTIGISPEPGRLRVLRVLLARRPRGMHGFAGHCGGLPASGLASEQPIPPGLPVWCSTGSSNPSCLTSPVVPDSQAGRKCRTTRRSRFVTRSKAGNSRPGPTTVPNLSPPTGPRPAGRRRQFSGRIDLPFAGTTRDRPEQSILVRGHSWGAYASLILPIALLTVGGLGIWLARVISSSPPPQHVAPGGLPRPRPPRSRGVIQALQNLAASSLEEIDPSQFGDPLAMKTEWSPLKGTGGNFRAHKLVEVDPDRLAFRATMQGILFALVFLLPGTTRNAPPRALGLASASGLSSGRLNLNMFIALPVALLFCAAGGYLLYSWTTPIVFDRRTGLFWKGWKAPDELSDLDSLKNVAGFGEIHALQSSFPITEVNTPRRNQSRHDGRRASQRRHLQRRPPNHTPE